MIKFEQQQKDCYVSESDTENEIRKIFQREDLQNFMFESIFGTSAYMMHGEMFNYRDIFSSELKHAETELVRLVRSHISHNIPINRSAIVTFVLTNIVAECCKDNGDCNRIQFFAFCNYLYYVIFDRTRKYFVSSYIQK